MNPKIIILIAVVPAIVASYLIMLSHSAEVIIGPQS